MGDPEKARVDKRSHGKNTMRTGVRVETGRKYKFVVKRSGKLLKEARWARVAACVGEEVGLEVVLERPAPAPLTLTVFEHDPDGEPKEVEQLEAKVEGTTARATWKARLGEERPPVESREELEAKGWSAPKLFFKATLDKESLSTGLADAELLTLADTVELELKDPAGKPQAGVPYVLTTADGESRTGTLDAAGRIREEVVPGPWFVELGLFAAV